MKRLLMLFIITVICSIPLNLNAGLLDDGKGDIDIEFTPILKTVADVHKGQREKVIMEYPVSVSYNDTSFIKRNGEIVLEIDIKLKSNGLYAKHFGEKNAMIMGEITFPEDVVVKHLNHSSSLYQVDDNKTKPNVINFFLEQKSKINASIVVSVKIPKGYIGEYVTGNVRSFYCEGVLKKYREAISLTLATLTGVSIGAKVISIPWNITKLVMGGSYAVKTMAKSLTPALKAAGVVGLGTDFFTRVVAESNSRLIEQAKKDVSKGNKDENSSKSFSLLMTE